MEHEHMSSSKGGRIEEVQSLVALKRKQLETWSKEALVDLAMAQRKELLGYQDLTCGPESAARFFNRKRSWVYEAMSRPHTKLQKCLCRVVARDPGGLLFRLSDLMRLRRQLFERDDG